MGRNYQNLTYCTRLWHSFCYAPVKLFHVEHCTKIKCFTWNTMLYKVKRII